MSRPFTLMLTSTGGELSPQAIRLAQASARHDIRVVACEMRGDVLSRHVADAFALVPAGTDSGYAAAVEDIVRREGIDLIIPGSDEEALSLSKARDRLAAAGCQVAASPYEHLRIVADKIETYRALAAAGIALPLWRAVSNRAELEAAVRDIVSQTGSAVVKPAADRGSRGVYVLSDAHTSEAGTGAREQRISAARFFEEVAGSYTSFPAMVMEKLEEPVHDVDVLAWEGEAIHLVPRRRVSSALPNAGHVFLDVPELREIGRVIAHTLHLTWLYDIDIMFDGSATPRVLEVNPRPSGSWPVTVAAGVPLLDDIVSLAKGELVGPATDPAGRIVRPYQSLFAFEAP